MKNVKKILSVLALIVLVGSDFLTSISYALDDMLEDSVVVQTENEEEIESIETEEEKIDEEDVEDVYESESMEEEKLETENLTGDIVEEGTGEVSEIGSGEVEELTEETAEGATGDIAKELTGEVIESIRTGEETVIENITYNEEPIIGEKTYNDVTVRVEALTGIFPEGTELKIEPIKWWNLSSLKDKLVEEKEEIKEDTTVVAFDITFKYEGEEVQPKDGEKVKVTFDYSSNEDLVKADKNENQEISVYHIDDETNEGTKLDIVNKDEDEIEILATEFSTYTIVVQRAEETPQGQPTQTWTEGTDFFSINIPRPEGLTNADGPTGFIIMDRNLGATSDDISLPSSYGYLYQWGNNYGFNSSDMIIPTTPDGVEYNASYRHNGYMGNIFITDIDWSKGIDYWIDGHHNDLWGGENDTVSNNRGLDLNNQTDRQGPCPSGWHVPSKGEWDKLLEYWMQENGITADSNGGFDGAEEVRDFLEELKLPFAGDRDYKDGWYNGPDVGIGFYWSSTSSGNDVYDLIFDGSHVYLNGSDYRALGKSVRCFKDVYKTPIVYTVSFDTGTGTISIDSQEIESGLTASQPITQLTGYTAVWYLDSGFVSPFDFDTPITGNITLYAKWHKNRGITDQMPDFTWGEISIPRPESISTGPDYYIIMDRNLGATSSGTVCDTGSNNGICGLLYQFGNNYGFSYDNINMAEKCNEKSVDLNEYSPSNPYYDSAFIYGKKKCNNVGTDTDWAAISNYDIWGGKDGSYTDRQGPCPDEWHLPTQKEWEEAINYWTVGESDQGTGVLNDNNISAFRDYFQLPFAGGRSRSDGKISHVGLQGSYDTVQTNKGAPYILRITTTGGIVDSNTTYNQVNGYSIRCFKNIYEEEYYTVTFKNRDGDILWSGEVLAGKTPVYSGSQPSRPATEESVYSFNGWYPEIKPVTSDVVYTATYNENPRLYTVTLTGTPTGYGTLTPESLTKEYGTTIVISGDKLTVGGTEVILTGNEGYEFQEWTGTCEKIEKQVCDEFTVYSHSEPIEFTGGNNLIITNPGYDLFSESNYQKDFEISFDIVEQNLSSSVSQATILNVKDEDQEDIWPGFVIRKSGTDGKIEISATSDYGKGFQTKSYSLENLHNMKISRINSILYVSINGEANQEIYDYSGFYNYFTKPIVFGSSYKDSNHLFRPAKITLSNILIKSADNCYTGNVYIVTGDCQMTAKFKEVEEHPKVTVNHHWMNIGGSDYTIHETEYFSGNIGDEFTAIEKVYTGFTAKLNNDDTIIISGDNNSNVIDLYYDRHRGYFYFLIDPFNSAAITVSGCDNGTCWYGEDVQLTVQEETGYIFNSWGIPTSITLPEGLDRTQKTLSFTMPEINDMQIRWSVSLTAIPYTIIYHLDGGEEVEHNQTEYTAGNFVIYVTDPIKTGYDFLGWTGGVINGPKLSGPTTGLVIVVNDMGNIEVGDREYYANWTPNKYAVTGSVAEGQENMGYLSGLGNTGINLTGLYDYGTELIFIAIPELGYVFDYWTNRDQVLSGTDLGDGKNQLTVIVDQILDIIAFFKPSDNTPYTVEHYKQNLDKTGYEFAWSGTMYGTTDEQTSATGTGYEGFTLSGDLANYQTGIKADGSTVVRLYYDRNTYTVTRNMWEGHLNRRKIDKNVPYGTTPIFEWDDEDKYTPKRGREVDTDDIKYDFIFTGWIKSGSTEIIKDLTTQIVTGDVTYIAQYDTGYRYYEVRYHTDEGTGTMEPQSLQLYSSGTLNKNKFIRTGYEFSGWWYEYGDGIEVFYEDEQEINLGVEDDVIKSDAEWEDPLYLDVYAQWKPSTGTKVTVNYYLKDLDAENNVLINSKTEYATGVEFTGNTDDVVDILSRYGTGIEGYEYSKSIVYGPDYPTGVETGTTTILADGSRVIDMYYVPNIYQFTLNSESYSSTAGSSESTGYYYGAKVTLSGDINDDCFTRSGWTTSGITLLDNTVKQTSFIMPSNDVEVTSSTIENTYNIIFNGNGSTSGNMSPMNGVRCTESTGLTINTFEKSGHTFTGWSTTFAGTKEYTDGQTVSELSKVDGDGVTLYAVWNINEYEIDANVATGDHGYLSGMGSVGISLTGLYDFGETLVVIAIPELGYLFDYWEVNGSQELPESVTASGNQLTAVVDQILDIVAHFKENVGTITVNYYHMNTWGTYPGITNTTTFTGLVGYTGYATVNPPVGFHLDTTQTISTGIVISDNNVENVINIYYARNLYGVTLSYTGDFYGEEMTPGRVNLVCTTGHGYGRYYYEEHVHCEATANTGYIVKGWTYSGGNNVSINGGQIDFDMGTGEVHLTLDGDIINYYIYYDLDGGIENPERPNNRTGYTVRDYSFEIYDPIKTGYIFLGWTGGVNGTGVSTPASGLIVNVASGVGNMLYYANWTGVEYVVTVYIEPENGGTVHGSGVYHYKDRISLLATPNVDSGYQFTGWYVGYDKISDYYQIGLQADDSGGTGLTAKFELKTYQVCVSSDYYRGSHYPSAGCYPYQHGSIVTVNAWPYEGYKVRNWMINDWERKTGDNQTYTGDNLDLTINWDTNVFINFEPIKYNVVYMSGDTILTGLYPSEYDVETLICDENYSYEYGGCMYYLPTLTRDGYDFTGWYNTPLVSSYDRIKVLSGVGDKAIYAGWLVHDYNITYHLGSGESFSGAFYPYEYESYNIETPSIALPQAQKSGYVFSGWVDYNGKLFTEFGGGMTGDLDLYPTWRPDVMNITVNYYEMNTGGQYYPSSWTYYETYHYTGFTNSGFTAPDYTTTGFRLDGNMHPNGNPSIVISGNENANVIDVYYEREKYNLETLWPTSWADMTITPSPIEYNSYYFGTEINITIAEHIGYRFTGWYQEEGMEFPADEVMDLTSRNITFHMPAHNVKVFPDMEHIEYILTFTGYEWAEVTNREYIHVTLTGENYEWYDTELVLPDLNKPGYNFLGWFSGEAYVWSTYYWWQDHYPTWHMPAQDIELRAEFTGRTDMRYYRYYYLQDTEGTGYTLSGNLTDSEYDGVTNQEIPGRFGRKYITGFEYTGFGYSGEAMLPREEWPIIKATGENYVDLYYDRKVDSVYVEYDVNKMSVTGTGEYRYEAPVTLTATVKTGYEFSGFNSYWGELLTTDPVYNFTMPDGYVYLRANADPIVYSIDYELNGGESYYSYPTGYTIEDENFYLSDPYKDGYTFLGWTGGVISGEQLSGLTTELVIPAGSVGDRKYFANWEPAEVDVTVNYHLKKIDAENNELLDDSVFFTGKMFTGLTDDVVDISEAYGIGIEGYSYTTAIVYGPDLSGGVETGTTTVLSGRSIDIYYTPIKYDFTVVAGPNTTTSGTSISTGYYYGAYVTLSGDSTDDCFEWDKWGSQTLPEGKNQQHTTFEMPAHNVIVESMVKEKSYNIVFNANGGTGMMSTLSVQCTTGTLAPNKFERDGYTFTGWSRNAEGPVEFTGESDIHRLSTESGGEVTLFAIWDVNWYTVTFDLNGGSLTGDMTLTTGYTIKTPAISLENYIPIKTGYNFSGWYKGDDVANNIAGGEIGNYTLTAKWEAIPFTVSFNSASGTAVESQIYYYDNLLSGLNSAVTTRTGYDFSGWYLSGVLYTSGSRMPAENITLTAKWTPLTGIEYQVNHRGENTGDNNYSILLSGYKMYGTSDTQTIASSLEFEGFTLSGSVNQEIINPDGTTVVDIYYDRNEYEVTTGTTENGSISGETGNQRYGKRITFTAHPSAGYRLARWLKNGEEILSGGAVRTGEEIEIEVDTGMEISAEFKARGDTPYYVEYYKENLDGGYDVWTGIQYGTSDTEGVAQELIFTGFIYDSGNVNNVITGNIDGDGSKVLKMYYNREIYTITWLNEDGTDMDTTSVKYGEVPTHADPTQPADAHYTYKFKGWDPEPTFATGEISYRATYEHIVNKHTITWKNDDGSLIDKTMVEYGTIPTHAKPTKTETEDYRYIFAGWDPEVVAVVGDAEYTAVFNAEKKEKSSKGGGMSGGGGRGGNIDNSDNQHGSAEERSDLFTGDNDTNSGNINDEPLSLYEWVHENDITTMDTLEYADPDGLLTRGHLAKMVVNYMVNVLGRKIPYDVTYNCRYWGDDESSRESDEIRDYATKACAFGVMGINMEDNKFLPNSIVTRAEFGTVMSRVLRGDKYDITDTDNRSYYENHLQALKKDNILTQIANPETRWEIRKWVWLVFRRIVEKYKK